jgi:hypothetical protein
MQSPVEVAAAAEPVTGVTVGYAEAVARLFAASVAFPSLAVMAGPVMLVKVPDPASDRR